MDIVELTLCNAQAGMAAGEFSAADLVRAYLARIRKYDRAYNSIIALNPRVLEEACAIDESRAAGEILGPLTGMPIVVRDSYNVAEMVLDAVCDVWNGGEDTRPKWQDEWRTFACDELTRDTGHYHAL
jgi:Asp-tRNA(Asn)/Glu-tRNA(Gln) amidotransferase A subunit family amidase